MECHNVNKIVIVIAVIFALTSCTRLIHVPRINKEDLMNKLGSTDLILLDVRISEDWQKSMEKIVGARRVDPADLSSWVDTLPKDKEIVLYCA